MTYSYSAAHLSQPLHRLRLEIGDTQSTRPLLQDEEILQVISEESAFNIQVSRCCHLICAKLAGDPEYYRLGTFRESFVETYKRYKEMAERYAGRGTGEPWAGSIEAGFKSATELDTSLVSPKIKKGMHDA